MKHPGMINIVSDTSNEIFEWSERNFSKVKIVIES